MGERMPVTEEEIDGTANTFRIAVSKVNNYVDRE